MIIYIKKTLIYRQSDALFLINVYGGPKCCPSVLETICTHISVQKIHDFFMFICCSSHCPSARCASAADAVCIFIIFVPSCYYTYNICIALVFFQGYIGFLF
jgi:hypothetical protein